MKRIYIILTLSIVCCMAAMAQNSPGMAHQTAGDDRLGKKTSYERPIVNYDSQREVIEITGSADYYNLMFVSRTSDFVDVKTAYGPADEVSVDYLPDGVYTMTVITPVGSSYVWTLRKGTEPDLLPSGMGGVIQPRGGVGSSILDLFGETM